jgi:inosose dehydratase
MLDRKNIKLGIAPIAWAEDDMPEYGKETTFLQIIDEIKLTGYEGTEVGCKFPHDAAFMKAELDRRGLENITQWFSAYLNEQPYWMVERDFIDHANFLKATGATLINVSDQSFSVQHRSSTPFTDKPVLKEAQWKELGDGLNKLGKIAKDKGMKIVYHHHMTTTVQTAEEIDKLMEHTDPEYLSLIYDTGHLAMSGEDYLKVLDKHFDRIAHIHLKNIRKDVVDKCRKNGLSFLKSVLEGAFTVPGDPEGCVDFPSVFKILEERNYKGWLVVEAEQNPYIYNAYDYAVMARKYMKEQIGF